MQLLYLWTNMEINSLIFLKTRQYHLIDILLNKIRGNDEPVAGQYHLMDE